MQVSAQISLYPLRQPSLSPAIEEAWKILKERKLDLEKGPMSSMVNGGAEEVFQAIKEVFLKSAELGPVSMVVTYSNACPIQVFKV
jgi:uncharacterized protein YqgV (UPF0045/DUF77 family)